MSILDIMKASENEYTPDTSPNTSDTESPPDEPEHLLRNVTEPDVSLDEMLSLACRQGKLDIVQLLLQSGAHVNHRNKAGNTPLLEACSQGHVEVANFLLENGSLIDAPTETTLDSALTWACTLGNQVIVDALLKKKANVEHRTKDGCTALMFACLAGHKEVAEKLLDAKSEINVESDSNKDSPLTFACWKGHCSVVELLLSRTANIEHRTKEGFSPLMFAALGGHTDVARKLLERDAQVNVPSGSNNDIPLTSACWKGHHDVVQLLLEYTSNIEHRTKDGCTPLMLAAREGHIHVAQLLLLNKAEVNVPSGSENNIPLTLACWKGHCQVVRLLLDNGSDIEHRNKAGCTPLMLASREGHLETTRLLLEKEAQVNIPSGSNDDTPLTLACWKGHHEVVVLLLEYKSNIDHQTKTGCTPLMEATREGHKAVAEILLNHNADVELPDNYGQSPLFMACWKGHRDVAELLLYRTAHRDCRTKTGITPLFQACRENHVSIVELLLDYGAGVNAPFPNSRENPMTLSAEKGHKELVELLLSRGATHDCRTKKGCTPAFLACKEGHTQICHRLFDEGANMELSDCRGSTPIMAAFKNGHVVIVEWLVNHVHHLPSDELCHKILMSSVDDKDKETMLQRRSKCLTIIQEVKKKREQLALRNAQILVKELDDERNREEKKKKKQAAKRRDKRNKRKKNRVDGDPLDKLSLENGLNDSMNDDGSEAINDDVIDDEDDEDDNDEDDDELKDNMLPTENREGDEEEPKEENNLLQETIMIEELLTRKENEILNHQVNTPSKRRLRKKRRAERTKGKTQDEKNAVNENNENNSLASLKINSEVTNHVSPLESKPPRKHDTIQADEKPVIKQKCSDVIDVTDIITARLTEVNVSGAPQRDMVRTSGVSTASTMVTTGSSRVTTTTATSIPASRHKKKRNTDQVVPVISSIALTTAGTLTTTTTDPRTVVSNITPIQHIYDWDDEDDDDEGEFEQVRSEPKTAPVSSSVSQPVVNESNYYEEFRDSDWLEVSRSHKVLMLEMIVPNGYCGRVIGKGGKKINQITEESGAQITIEKPTSNLVPTRRLMRIKGTPLAADKARMMVTLALNTPSYSKDGTGSFESALSLISKSASFDSDSASTATPPTSTRESPRTVGHSTSAEMTAGRSGKKVVKPSSTIPHGVLPYSKVAKGQYTVEDVQKHLMDQAKKQGIQPPPLPQVSPPLAHQTSPLQQQVSLHNSSSHDRPSDSDPDSSVEKSGYGALERSNSKETSPGSIKSPTSTFGSKDFSYFSPCPQQNQHPQKNQHPKPRPASDSSQAPLQGITSFVDNASKTNELPPFPWQQGSDRGRSVSWTDKHKPGDNQQTESDCASDPGSLSVDSVTDRQTTVVSPWNTIQTPSASKHIDPSHHNKTPPIDDEQVFTDDVMWNNKIKPTSSEAPTSSTEGWEISSSPTSSVSSSKVELNNILDNENPWVTSSLSENGGSQVLPDPALMDNDAEASPWQQTRGAYSAPSSPALLRNENNPPGSTSQTPYNMRAHPSMEELNSNRPWLKNQQRERPNGPWNSRQSTPPAVHERRSNGSSSNNLNSTPTTPDTKLASPRVRTSDSRPLEGETPAPLTMTSQWSANRFQDVRTVSDLLSQLSLDKYTNKFEEQGISLDMLMTFTENNLQAFGIPKGPRLKILKASEVIRGRHQYNPPPLHGVNQFMPPLSQQHLVLQHRPNHIQPPPGHSLQTGHNLQTGQQLPASTLSPFPDFQLQPGFNMMLQNNSMTQNTYLAQTLPGVEFLNHMTMGQSNLGPLQPATGLPPPPGPSFGNDPMQASMLFPENPGFYFYPQS